MCALCWCTQLVLYLNVEGGGAAIVQCTRPSLGILRQFHEHMVLCGLICKMVVLHLWKC